MSTTDSLTGIFNRRYYDNKLDYCLSHFQRTGQIFSLILIDIDFFKSINDSYGHHIGDRVLQAVTDKLKNNLRDIDVLARVGGEEFAIILPGTSDAHAHVVAERHRQAVASVNTINRTVTASFGVAQVRHGDSKTTIYSSADKALYLSKSKGRNCVT